MKTLLNYFLTILVISALMLQSRAIAVPVLDQNQPVGGGVAYITYYSQTFQQAGDNISGAGVYFLSVVPDYTFTYFIWDDDPFFGGNLVASGSTTTSLSGAQWVDIFWNPVAVIPDSTLYLQFYTGTQINGISWGLSTDDQYSRGSINFLPTKDTMFRTYTTPAEAVPDMGSAIAMLGGALIGLFALRRRFLS